VQYVFKKFAWKLWVTTRVIQLQSRAGPLINTQMPVPLSMTFETTADRKLSRVFIQTKHVIAAGGERKVKLSADLLTGKWFIRKRVIQGDSSELGLLSHFRDNPHRGIAEVTCLFEKATKKGPSPKNDGVTASI
jgi:predicted phage-related endonuclease